MTLHRALREEQLRCDLGVGEPHHEHAEDLLLSHRQALALQTSSHRTGYADHPGSNGVKGRAQRPIEVGVAHEPVGTCAESTTRVTRYALWPNRDERNARRK